MSSIERRNHSQTVQQQYRMLHDIYVLLDDGDRQVLEVFELTTSQYAVLMLLDREDGRRLTSVSDRLLRARSTITRIVDQLEAARLVQRVADPEDRRAQRVVLTEEGATRREKAYAAHVASLARRLTILDSDEAAALNILLDKLRAGLRQDLSHNGSSKGSQAP
jgi:MarR family transcriptional regulator, 2-MHQ and catechol-resistance regulon repressor